MDEERVRQIFREELEKILGAYASIPHNIGEAFIERLGVNDKAELLESDKAVADVLQEIDEAGASTHDVAKEPDGLKAFTEGATTVHIPYYNT